MRGSRRWLKPLLALLSGGGMVLLFPPFDLSQLVWLVLIPLLWALWSLGPEKRKRKALGLGLLTGLVFFLGSLSWLRTVTDVGWVVLAFYLSWYVAGWAVFAATWGNPWRRGAEEEKKALTGGERLKEALRSMKYAFVVASVWAGCEWLRGWVFTGFGWNPLGVAFHRTPVVAQSADLLGVGGLSVLVVFFQAVMLQSLTRVVRTARYRGPRGRQIDFLAVCGLMMLVAAYGVIRLSAVRQGEILKLNALLVQLNIPQDAAKVEWSAEEVHWGYEEETLEALEKIEKEDEERLKKALAESEGEVAIRLRTPDWIIWPESALTGRVLTAPGGWGMYQENWETLGRIRERSQATMMMGLVEREAEAVGDEMRLKEGGRTWNSLCVFGGDGSLQTFRKHHLVIFGEYIPFVESIPWLKDIYEQQAGAQYGGAFSRGESVEPLEIQAAGGTVSVIPSVCFEDTVPRVLRKMVRAGGPQVLVNVTNDGWFKESVAAEQHFANARFRAIEFRRPMIRSANSGVTAAVDPAGLTRHPESGAAQEVRDEKGSTFTRGHLLAEVHVPRETGVTLYAWMGDAGLLVLVALGAGIGWRQRREGKAPGLA